MKLPEEQLKEIRTAIYSQFYNQKQFCDETGIDPAALSRFLRGETGMSRGNIEYVKKTLNLVF